jgi:hypothetical protein
VVDLLVSVLLTLMGLTALPLGLFTSFLNTVAQREKNAELARGLPQQHDSTREPPPIRL